MEQDSPQTSTKPTFLLCPGQGAQSVGMGLEWFNASAAAKQTFAAADRELGFALSDICFEGPAETLNRTDIAQAAIYVTSVACYQGLVEEGKLEQPDVCAGLSLGEFTALYMAGSLGFIDGLRLVRLRGQAMQEAADAVPSSMVALTGEVSEARVKELCEKVLADDERQVLVPANFNSPMQVVVSGTTEACEKVPNTAEAMGFKATPLSVAGAFHSPLMKPAAEKLAAALDRAEWAAPSVPVIANVTAEPHTDSIDEIKQRLVEQLTHPVRWSQSMRYAADHHNDARFVELAPGKVLTGLMRRTEKSIKVENYDTPK